MKFSFSASPFWITPYLSSWSTNKIDTKRLTSEINQQPQCTEQTGLLFLSSDICMCWLLTVIHRSGATMTIDLLILGDTRRELRAWWKRWGKAKAWGRSGVCVLTISRFELQERCFFSSIFAALLDALHFAPEVLHGGAVHGGLRVGATECRRRCRLVGKHPVNSSTARERLPEKRGVKIRISITLTCTTQAEQRESFTRDCARKRGTRWWRQPGQLWWSSGSLLLILVVVENLLLTWKRTFLTSFNVLDPAGGLRRYNFSF